MKSGTVLPLVNLPVELGKKLDPYGGKSARIVEFFKKRLFPASRMESPKLKIAGEYFVFSSELTTVERTIIRTSIRKFIAFLSISNMKLI